eukprot:5542102-Prymnesium_polylepis.1
MAALVARVQLHAVLLCEMRGESGRTCGWKAGRAMPVRRVSRHATRSAASSCKCRVDVKLAECLEGGAAVGHSQRAHGSALRHPRRE